MSEIVSREELDAVIAAGLTEYDEAVRARWDAIRIEPERWECGVKGARYGGLWVVAIDGERALWFDEHEDSFQWATFSTRGVLRAAYTEETGFLDILEQIAQELGAAARARVPEGPVPPALSGPGTIALRQTTYWDLATAAGARFRVHFRERVDARHAGAAYDGVTLVERHPVLAPFDEPPRSLYFTGESPDPGSLAERLDRAIRDASDEWRGLSDYVGTIDAVARRLAGRFGMLMDAPESACRVAANVLEAHGVQCSILGSRIGERGYRAVLFGRSFVIARGFAFESLDG